MSLNSHQVEETRVQGEKKSTRRKQEYKEKTRVQGGNQFKWIEETIALITALRDVAQNIA